MKKLLIVLIIINVINFIVLTTITILICNKCVYVDILPLTDKCDTTINKIRIDSIEYVIRTKDSIINRIKYEEKEYIKKIDTLNDDANVKLFKELVSK